MIAAALNIHKKTTKRQSPAANNQPPTALDHARQATSDYLAHFPPTAGVVYCGEHWRVCINKKNQTRRKTSFLVRRS